MLCSIKFKKKSFRIGQTKNGGSVRSIKKGTNEHIFINRLINRICGGDFECRGICQSGVNKHEHFQILMRPSKFGTQKAFLNSKRLKCLGDFLAENSWSH